MDLYLLTKEDIQSFNDVRNSTFIQNGYNANILPKLQGAGPHFNKDYIINVNLYPKVYILSDLHADFRKFIQIMKQLELIQTTKNPYSDEIYAFEFIAETQWVGGGGVLLLILGDLVDGRRAENYVVDDNAGSFELLIHCFLHNLRIKALKANSEVRFTMGNHDLGTVLNESDKGERMYEDYVADTAKRFFLNDYKTRQNALKPFYQNCPFFLLSLENGSKLEVACVHGGLHSENYRGGKPMPRETPLTDLLRQVQNRIKSGDDILQSYNEAFVNMIGYEDDPLWTRIYERDFSNRRCDLVQQTKYNLVIVGHCVTDQNFPTFRDYLWTQKRFEDCNEPKNGGTIGCVLLDCDGHEHKEYPHLAYVDTGLSQAFRIEDNERRNVQILSLKHDDTIKGPEYYNEIKRIQVGGDNKVINDFVNAKKAGSLPPTPSPTVPTPSPTVPTPSPTVPTLPTTKNVDTTASTKNGHSCNHCKVYVNGKRIKGGKSKRRRKFKNKVRKTRRT